MGGWSTVKTQDYVLTPNLVNDVVKAIRNLGNEFNEHLNELELPNIEFINPVGSVSWWEEDMIQQPEKTYGDVDFLIAYPTLKLTAGSERDDELATVKLYNQEILMLIQANKYSEIDITESLAISTPTSIKFIINTDEKKIQVDFVVTHKEYIDWAIFRYTPMKNVKGFVLGYLYSSISGALDLSFQARGVRGKFIENKLVSYNKRLKAEDRLISADKRKFLQDIGKFFCEYTNKEYCLTENLSNWKMNVLNPNIEDLCKGVLFLAEFFEKNNLYSSELFKFSSSKEFLNEISQQYEKRMKGTFNSSKFDKASTEEAKNSATLVKQLTLEYIDKVNKMLIV